MLLQNREDPHREIHTLVERDTLMGRRGQFCQ
jgi:hypothetical protein